MIDLVMDASMNLLDIISDIFVADITKCYETILLKDDDNLLDAITFIGQKWESF
jgi:hypothetical protein